ncbi:MULTISPECIES: hypothetical protein [Bacillus]|uniref:hypothetical protein n=1 Tax=Bacillus TaxID=1386 RepID=UPI00026B9DF6|nr:MULTISPECIES: hypothetical protein [Bacillus]AIW30965.1 hypothetical protein KO64_14270 [Bacillus subtilis]AZG40069.1 hypothetical protein EG219_13720 [Bacillus velezensis]EJD66069.1 YjcN [Bacillus sp. 916]MBU8887541.1 hypothetical protein [Bacillus sp. FJAT-27001]MEC2313421.1 hypothetical protein [Bacillus velezensis]
MKKKIYLLLTLSAALALLLTALPALSPVVFTSASEKGAIRHDIYKKGYPYQSYFAILRKEEGGGGQTPHVCYSKKSSEGEYKVSCGTGP